MRTKNEDSRHTMPGKAKRVTAARTETGAEGVSSHVNNDSRSKEGDEAASMDKRAKSTERTMQEAVRLRMYYPEAWEGIAGHALDLAERGSDVSMQYLLECARSKDYIDSNGRDLHVSNDCGAVFARWLLADYPELAGHIVTRPSVYDSLAVPCDPATGEPQYRYFARLAGIYG